MTLATPGQLADPLAGFMAQDPTVLQQGPPPVPPVAIATRPHDRIAWEIAAAVIVAGTVIRHHLQQRQPQIEQVRDVHAEAWRMFAPSWLRLTVPAIRQAYALGRVEGLTDDELTVLATDYANSVGDYFSTSSADAIEQGFNAQLAQRWSPELAWYRASAAYGLDARDMKAYLKAAITDKSADPIPAAAKVLVDRLFLARAERLGTEEAYSATQAGQAVSWLWLERNGRIPLGSTREWELGENEQHCATCAELAMQDVPLDQPFVLRSGAKIWAPRAHPRCHCRVKLNPPRVELGKAMPRAAGVALVAADTGRVLMLQRCHDPRDPAGGTWEFPGGCLEHGEPPWVGAQREWEEEVRRRLPKGLRPRGIWVSGPYVGFALEVPDESCVPTHSRGRVANPDDPDGDQVEAIAWWDPKHLTSGNLALRKELRWDLGRVKRAIAGEISKADDHWKREPRSHGRWAKVAEDADPVLTPAEEEPVSPFKPGTGSPFRSGSPFHAGSPFRTESPVRTSQASPFKAASPFASAFHQGHRPRPENLEVRRVVVVGLPVDPPPSAEPYYLAADAFHLNASRAAIGAHYGTGGLVDFNKADVPPVASNEINPWDSLPEDLILAKSVPASMTNSELDEHWDALERKARLGFNVAFTEVDDPVSPIAARLTESDLSRIYRMAGYEDEADGTEEHANAMRTKIKLAVRHHGEGSPHVDALAEAYADYVTYADPKRLLTGQTGADIARELDECEAAGMVVRHSYSDPPVPVEQVFSFSDGFHPHTSVDQREARIEAQYSPYVSEYHSALANYDAGQVPPMRFGLQVLHMVPMEHEPGILNRWVPIHVSKRRG